MKRRLSLRLLLAATLACLTAVTVVMTSSATAAPAVTASSATAASTVAQADTSGAGLPTSADTFSAPLVNGYGGDPTMVYDRQDGYYYLSYNQGNIFDMVIRRARSIAGLATAPNVVVYSGTSQYGYTGIGSGGYLKHFGDHWYIYNNSIEKGPSVLESAGNSAYGPYSVKAFFEGAGPNNTGYAFQAEQIGGNYYAFETAYGVPAYGIYIRPMINPWTVSGSWQHITAPDTTPVGWQCYEGCTNEGSSIAVHDGKVFDLFSASSYPSPNYCVGMLTAQLNSNLLDPASWKKEPDCVFKRNDAAGVYGPGSMTFFDAPSGALWAVYHVKTTTDINYSGNDRRLEAEPIKWGSNGMPNLGEPYALGTQQALPGGDPGVSAWEASKAILKGVDVRQSPTAVGGKYVTGIDKASSAVSFVVKATSAGTYRYQMRYASGAVGPVTEELYVNGRLQTSAAFDPTGSSDHFQNDNYATLSLTLPAGTSIVTVRPDGAKGQLGSKLSLDEMVAVPYDGSQEAVDAKIVDVSPRFTQTATGLVNINGNSLEGPLFVGGINYSDSAATFTLVVPKAGTYGMQVYYDNGLGAATMTLIINGGKSSTASFPSTGTFLSFGPNQFATIPVALEAGVNTVRLGKGTNYVELDRVYVPETPQ